MLAAGLGSVASSPAVAAAGAAQKICVALVVDARSINAGVSTGCAKVTAGATGVDVLQAAGHRVTFRSDGLLCTIDGLPSTGCSAVDDTHYWAYFHRAPGRSSWSYSTEGPSTYRPTNDSTEGWVYDDGKKLAPKSVPYRAICPPEAATPSNSPVPTPSSRPGHLPSHRPHPLGSPRPSRSIRPNAGRHPGPPHHHRATPIPVPSFSGSPPVRPTLHPTGGGSGNGGLTGAIIAAAIVVAIGAVTVLTNRRRRGQGQDLR